MKAQNEFIISLDSTTSSAQVDKLAQDLQKDLEREGLNARRLRTDETSQDFGASIVLVLGAPAVVIAAKALRDWVNRKRGRLLIRDKSGEIVADGLDSKDVAAIAESLSKRLKTGQ